MSETAKTAAESKPRKKSRTRKATKKTQRKGRKAAKKASSKKSAPKKKARKKVTKKKVRASSKPASKPSARGGRRAPQGRRLGGWEIVKRDEVFKHLKKTGTTIATLARTLDVGSSAVHAWKAGRRFPSEQAQLKLKQILQGKLPTVAAPKGKGTSAKASAFSGKTLRKVREERGLSRAKLSKQLGVSAGSIRNWEAGVSKPRGGNLTKVQEFLDQAPAGAAHAALPGAVAQGALAQGAGAPGDAAVSGAAQVAAAYLAGDHSMSPEDVVQFVASLRTSLS